MGIDVKHFLWINGVLVGVIALSIFLRRKGTATPSRLNMRAGNPPPRSGEKGLARHFKAARFARRNSDGSKNLNVIFNYNGHSWDAYETLGVPAGSSKAVVEKAYREILKTIDSGSRDFIDTAYKSIIES